MSDINTTVFTGRIVRDPELQTTATGLSVCTFNIAVEKGYGENKKVVYPTIVAWKGTAEFVSKLRKGTKVAVAAEYDERSWQTKNGDKRKAYDLRWEFARNISESTVKKYLTEIVAFWMYLEGDDSRYIDESDVYDILDLNDYEEELAYDQVLDAVAFDPMRKLWLMVLLYMNDNNQKGYFTSYDGEYKTNKRLSAYYDLLIKMGYAMSDEEKQMRDGTHPLFVKEESK